MTGRIAKSVQKATLVGEDGRALTAGDLSRLLQVDLKTIHNWVAVGHLHGRRTKGRHLRFARSTVARFARRFAYPMPPTLAEHPAAVLYVSRDVPHLGSRGWMYESDLFSAGFQLGGDTIEVAVLELDGFGVDAVKDLVAAVREFTLTTDVALVGLSDKPLRRRGFLAIGGDVAMPATGPAAVRKVAEWLVGGTTRLPRGVETQGE